MTRCIFALAAAVALAVALSGCGTTGGNFGPAMLEIAKDPNCAHTDRLNVAVGGLSGMTGSVLLERQCPQPTADSIDVQELRAELQTLAASLRALTEKAPAAAAEPVK